MLLFAVLLFVCVVVDVASLLRGARGLCHDLDEVVDNTEEAELRRLYVERYNHYLVSLIKTKIQVGREKKHTKTTQHNTTANNTSAT